MARTVYHRTIGKALGYHGEVAELVIRCGSCERIQVATLDADAKAKAVLPEIACESCGRLGLMRMWQPSAGERAAASAILDRAARAKGAA